MPRPPVLVLFVNTSYSLRRTNLSCLLKSYQVPGRPAILPFDLTPFPSCVYRFLCIHRGTRYCTREYRQTGREREPVWPTARFLRGLSPFVVRLTVLYIFTEVEIAMSNLQFPHIYPDPESRKLRKALVGHIWALLKQQSKANYHLTQAADCNVPIENILVGCGADEVNLI